MAKQAFSIRTHSSVHLELYMPSKISIDSNKKIDTRIPTGAIGEPVLPTMTYLLVTKDYKVFNYGLTL